MNTTIVHRNKKGRQMQGMRAFQANSYNRSFSSNVLSLKSLRDNGKQIQKKTMIFRLQEISFSKFVRCFNKN